jgi:hypothetical protein
MKVSNNFKNFLLSLTIPFTLIGFTSLPKVEAQTINQVCTKSSEYNLVSNQNNLNYFDSEAQRCNDVIQIRRKLLINPSNIDLLLAKDLEKDFATDLNQICINLLKVDSTIIADNNNTNVGIKNKLRCRLVFKETTVFRIQKGDNQYLVKVAKLINKLGSSSVNILGGAQTEVNTDNNANNSSLITNTIENQTYLISKVKIKNIIKLWKKSTPEQMQFLAQLLEPDQKANVKCINVVTNQEVNNADNNSIINNSTIHNFNCKVEVEQTTKFK